MSVLALSMAFALLAQQAVPAAPRPGPSPDNVPACAGNVPLPPAPGTPPPVPNVPTTERPPLPPATQPAPIRPGAIPKHECFMAVAKRGNIDLLFVGDSITDFFLRADRGQAVWNKTYGGMRAANFGISGDTTQEVLGRMQSGEIDGFKAKLIVLMLGTNNINRNSNADIAAGDAAIVAEFRKRQPGAKVLILGVFPRSNLPTNPQRAAVREINDNLALLADNKTVFYLDIGQKFLNPDGTLIEGIMPDNLHPSPAGYQVWADAIAHSIETLMK